MSKKVLLFIAIAISFLSIRFIYQLGTKKIRVHAIKLNPFKSIQQVVELEEAGRVIGKVHFDSTNIYLELNENVEVFKEDQFIYNERLLGYSFVDFVKASSDVRKNKLQVSFDTIEIINQSLLFKLDSNKNKRIIKQLNNIKNAFDTIITEAKLDTGLKDLFHAQKKK